MLLTNCYIRNKPFFLVWIIGAVLYFELLSVYIYRKILKFLVYKNLYINTKKHEKFQYYKSYNYYIIFIKTYKTEVEMMIITTAAVTCRTRPVERQPTLVTDSPRTFSSPCRTWPPRPRPGFGGPPPRTLP